MCLLMDNINSLLLFVVVVVTRRTFMHNMCLKIYTDMIPLWFSFHQNGKNRCHLKMCVGIAMTVLRCRHLTSSIVYQKLDMWFMWGFSNRHERCHCTHLRRTRNKRSLVLHPYLWAYCIQQGFNLYIKITKNRVFSLSFSNCRCSLFL